MKTLNCITLFSLLICLISCVPPTGYKKMGDWGGSGYKDMKLSDNLYLVEYYSAAYTSISTNAQHALHRAAELSKEHGYRYFEITNSTDSSSTYITPIRKNTTVNTNSSVYGTYNGYYNNHYHNGSVNSYGDGYAKSTTTISGGNIMLEPGISLIIKLQKNKTKNSMDADAILSNYKK